MAKVTGLGHVGIYVKDMERMLDFYVNVLGMTVVDRVEGGKVAFLTGQPGDKPYEIVFTQSDQRTRAGQISFPLGSLEDLQDVFRKVKAQDCRIDKVSNHGIALGCYFWDLEDNRLEIYWPTGIDYPQPYTVPVDLELPAHELMAQLDALEPRAAFRQHYYGRDVGKRLDTPLAN